MNRLLFIDRFDICHTFRSPFVLYLIWALCSFIFVCKYFAMCGLMKLVHYKFNDFLAFDLLVNVSIKQSLELPFLEP